MENKEICCDYFEKIKHHFRWYCYTDDDGNQKWVMPTLRDGINDLEIRINYCPSCGEKVRSIELNSVYENL